MSAVFYGDDGELASVVDRSITGVEAQDDTLLICLSDGRDIVVWIDDDNELAMRVEDDGVH